jgi:hypothetical protein
MIWSNRNLTFMNKKKILTNKWAKKLKKILNRGTLNQRLLRLMQTVTSISMKKTSIIRRNLLNKKCLSIKRLIKIKISKKIKKKSKIKYTIKMKRRNLTFQQDGIMRMILILNLMLLKKLSIMKVHYKAILNRRIIHCMETTIWFITMIQWVFNKHSNSNLINYKTLRRKINSSSL